MPRKKNTQPWYFKYLRRDIRRIFQWSPEKKKSKARAYYDGSYHCELCGAASLERDDVQCDHIIPCVNVEGFDGWSAEIERTLDVKAEGLQWICKPCHYKKSKAENAERRRNKK